ncbi:methionyl-tRNA formyltransferase [Geminisphaera colitermitum]|uniref:methionyl-tRNA formyltransferase n=1 Tax=Geminisphaera colitermitum TaxID=1148786 RepID=UPI001E33A7F1|nr:methionyl-tRNA formyltransferase [Geminisphaera colitermitum]
MFTQPDRAVGRGQKVTPNAIKIWAQSRSIPVYQPEKLTDETRAELAALAPDVTLVMAYGHILRDAFIATPRLGTLNLHTSLLPKYRGASPIQTAVACGERETGVTLMRIVRQLDAGPIADVERVPIGPLDTALEVEARLSAACVPLVARALPRLAAGTLEFREQDHAAATFCRKLTKADGVLDFSAPAAVLAARINGLFPWPACSVEIDGQRVKLGRADSIGTDTSTDNHRVDRATAPDPAGTDSGKPLPSSSSSVIIEERSGTTLPGTIVPPADTRGGDPDGSPGGEYLCVATGSGVLRLHALQRPGGRMLPASEFLRGFFLPLGTRLTSEPMPKLVVTQSSPSR